MIDSGGSERVPREQKMLKKQSHIPPSILVNKDKSPYGLLASSRDVSSTEQKESNKAAFIRVLTLMPRLE